MKSEKAPATAPGGEVEAEAISQGQRAGDARCVIGFRRQGASGRREEREMEAQGSPPGLKGA